MFTLRLPLMVVLGLYTILTLARPAFGTQGNARKVGEDFLIVVFKPGVKPSADPSSISNCLNGHGASLHLMFGEDEDVLLKELKSRDLTPDIASYYRAEVPSGRLDDLAQCLLKQDLVDGAYVKPGHSYPVEDEPESKLGNYRRRRAAHQSDTPDFLGQQAYLGPAPAGIEALPYAGEIKGGRGQGVRIIDVEGAWLFTHEDLPQNQHGLVGGTNDQAPKSRSHGTAVAGIIGADLNGFGVTGIVPDADFRASSDTGRTRSSAIKTAADKLSPGDIILLEIHRPGPKATGKGQIGYIADEWWPDEFAAIRYAVARGIIVIEAAGNGNQNLDDPIYDKPLPGFPKSWKNPFNPENPQSGAIMVGAGAPSIPLHGKSQGAPRSRLPFSNYGQRVDVQGCGRAVVTTGYGNLWGGDDPERWYTDTFSGTSSASPIVVGAVAAVQGILLAHSQPRLTPAQAQSLLRLTGSPQEDEKEYPVSQRIGNQPNIRQLVAAALLGKPTPAE